MLEIAAYNNMLCRAIRAAINTRKYFCRVVKAIAFIRRARTIVSTVAVKTLRTITAVITPRPSSMANLAATWLDPMTKAANRSVKKAESVSACLEELGMEDKKNLIRGVSDSCREFR